MAYKKAPVSKRKAGKILRHGTIRGKKISKKQRGFFGSIKSGTYKGK